jgi:hypothetical protein
VNSGLAVAFATAVLKSILENSLVQGELGAQLGDAHVSTLPPDRVPIGVEERSQLNLFLYRLTPNTSWRNEARSGRKNGEEANGHKSALWLDLHYLVTAYGEQDLVAEILLGHAMRVLHTTPKLNAAAVQNALSTGAPKRKTTILSPGRAVLAAASASSVLDEMSIAPEFLGTEELARVWSALQARYRPSVTYKVSAAVIHAEK